MSRMLRYDRDAVLICAYLCDTCGAETPGHTTWGQVRAAAEPLGWMTLPTGHTAGYMPAVRDECPDCAQPTLFSESQ